MKIICKKIDTLNGIIEYKKDWDFLFINQVPLLHNLMILQSNHKSTAYNYKKSTHYFLLFFIKDNWYALCPL